MALQVGGLGSGKTTPLPLNLLIIETESIDATKPYCGLRQSTLHKRTNE